MGALELLLILHIVCGTIAVVIIDRIASKDGASPESGYIVLFVFHGWWLLLFITILGTLLMIIRRIFEWVS